MPKRATPPVDQDGRAHAEAVRIARPLHRAGVQVLGLWPAGPNVPVPPLAVRLAVAFHEVSGAAAAVVDANLRWPGTSIGEDEDSAQPLLFARRWLQDGVALIAPRQQGPAGAGVPQLRLLVRASHDLFAHLVMDLTGYSELGDHLEALEMSDGVMIVARARETTERELMSRNAAMPKGLGLGVILVG